MEYVFGTKGDKEVLKTKGLGHSDLSGFQTVERKYPDMTVTDTFRVVEKYKSDEDGEGNCYDWYEIDRHSRDTDRFLPQKDEIQAQIDYLAMMTGVEMEVQDGEEG